MSREILFRAKHTHAFNINEHLDGVWVYGYLESEKYINSIELEGEMLVDPTTVCQYTGLTDKNGIKIFEGDICRANNENYVVVYEKYQFILQNFYDSYYDNPCDAFSECKNIEVIGNIFDNPELLKSDG